tara:strand:+ start:251 stop:478 length:228 start_codon:yes stop_codon:yes gene_type:complete
MSKIDEDIWIGPWGKSSYKQMKEENKSKGLGDTVEKFTKMTGVKKLVEVIYEETGGDCGCNKRKDKLNKLFPYGK